MPAEDEGTTEDAVLGGRLRLRQPRRGHRFGHDGVLLAAAVAARAGDHAVDLGAGVGIAGLALAARVPDLTVTLVELDPQLAALAADNAKRNGLDGRVRVACRDVAAFDPAELSGGDIAHVLMNPPFNDPRRQNASPDAARARAHAAGPDTLAAWCTAARRLLAPNGDLTLIWRAEGLRDVLAALEGFGAVAVLPVHPQPDAAAIRVLVRGVKDSRAPLTLLPGLVLNQAAGGPTAAAEAVLREGAALDLGFAAAAVTRRASTVLSGQA